MSFALIIFVSLILATPVTIILDGPIILGLLAVAASVSLVIVGVKIRPGEAAFLSSVIRPIALVAALPAIWMLIQAMPLPISGLVHPIWKSAEPTLGLSVAGSISIDPGATLMSFLRYLLATAIAFGVAATAIDRHRAEWMFFALTVATIIIALMSLTFTLFDSGTFAGRRALAADAGGLGIIFTVAAALHATQSKAGKPDGVTSRVEPVFVLWLAGLAICLLSVIVGSIGATHFAFLFGVAIFVASWTIWRFSLGSWGIAAIISTISLAAAAVVAFQPGIQNLGLTLAFANRAAKPLIAVTQRIISETPWTGTGAGTFAAILPIYRDIDELTTGRMAPTAAAAITVEMGRPFFWVILVAAIALALALVRGAISRHRNPYYSAAGASCVVIITLLSFVNVGPLSTPIILIGSVAIGIAIAQSKSRYV